jgi:hypothetical protein
VAATLTMRALSVVGGAGVKGTALPGTRVCALGKVSGERAVDITLKAPADTEEVVLAAVARVRDAESGGLTTMSRTAAVRAGEVITGDAATFAGPAHRLHPQRPGAVRPDGTGARSGTPSATPARAQATPARTRATPARAQATPARTRATPARARAASRRARAATVPPAGGSLVIPSAIPSVVPSAVPSVAPQGVTSGAVASVAPAPSAGGAGGAPPPPPPCVTQASPPPAPAGGAPQASAGAFPQPLATAPGAVPSPSGAIVSFQPEAAGGEAPLPWGMAMSAKPVEPVRWVSPIDGPKALPMVVGGIGLLMAGLWAVVTVQRGRKRRKVL